MKAALSDYVIAISTHAKRFNFVFIYTHTLQDQYKAKPIEFLEMNCGGPQVLRAGKQFAKDLCNRRSLSAAEPATSPQVLNLRTALCNRAQNNI